MLEEPAAAEVTLRDLTTQNILNWMAVVFSKMMQATPRTPQESQRFPTTKHSEPDGGYV
jgi:hypothetical protein